MNKFDIDSLEEHIYFGKTKEYFEEVLKTYHIGAYRASVVMLWSVAISDIIYKLKYLSDYHNDKTAKKILEEVERLQDNNQRNSSWELKIINKIFNNTKLIDVAEYENLKYLQKQRHLCAHPTLKDNLELHRPNKNTTRALICNTLEGLLCKPPFFSQNIISEILEDLSISELTITNYQKLKKYIENRFLDRMNEDIENSLYRTLWKLTFRLENEECDRNRTTNLTLINILTERYSSNIKSLISKERDYYSQIAKIGQPLDFLIYYLSKNENFYNLLSDEAKIIIEEASKKTVVGKICGWFTRGNLDQHYHYLLKWIESDEFLILSEDSWRKILQLSDSQYWETNYAKLISAYYCASGSYDTANNRFQECILPNLKFFNQESALFLLEKIESNPQVYERWKASRDHIKIREYFKTFLSDDFKFEKYPHFDENTCKEG